MIFARSDPSLVGMQACAGAHHRAGELTTLRHDVRLMPPACVKPYVKRGKTDAADAEAICEAVARPTMRFVPVTSAERQVALSDHKTQDVPVRQGTRTVNVIRAHPGEFGIVVATAIHNIDRLLDAGRDVPLSARPGLALLADRLGSMQERTRTSRHVSARFRSDDALARRLATVPGVGIVSSSAFAATTPDISAFRSARMAGPTPRPHFGVGQERLGRISKAGSRYLRRFLYLGAMARIGARRGRSRSRPDRAPDWLDRMLDRKPVEVAAIALANWMARTIWVPIKRLDSFRMAAVREEPTGETPADSVMVRRSVR